MNKIKGFIILLFIVNIFLGFLFFQKKIKENKLNQIKAQTAAVTVTLNPASGPISSSGTDVNLVLNTNGQSVNAVDIKIEFSNDLVLAPITEGNITAFHDLFLQKTENNLITIQGGAITPYTGSGNLATFRITPKTPSSTGSPTFRILSSSNAVNIDNSELNLIAASSLGQTYTYTISSGGTGGTTPSRTPTPTRSSSGSGSNTSPSATPTPASSSGSSSSSSSGTQNSTGTNTTTSQAETLPVAGNSTALILILVCGILLIFFGFLII